ncbi:hypothetical protein BGLA2_1070023 [Burkholderia gladioli]|nr:hypothetical protein BGLA2_1070023 [Burkholderia gladioli]
MLDRRIASRLASRQTGAASAVRRCISLPRGRRRVVSRDGRLTDHKSNLETRDDIPIFRIANDPARVRARRDGSGRGRLFER